MTYTKAEQTIVDQFKPQIVTQFVYPPIPIRYFDWRATLNGYEPGDPMGEGPSEQRAIDNLLEQLIDKHAEPEGVD